MRAAARSNLLTVFALVAGAAITAGAPTGSITSPVNITLSNVYSSQNGSDDVNVIGFAGGSGMSSWRLDYKPVASGTCEPPRGFRRLVYVSPAAMAGAF